MRRPYCYALLLVLLFSAASAQKSDLKKLPLDDLSAFRNQAGNWMIVGDVTMDPSVDVHPDEQAPPADTRKKNRKSKNTEPEKPKAVTFVEGKGILLNMNDDSKKDHLVTIMEHGDIELEFDVMLPKGSNSGIYLQGRYEVQLFDSWGSKSAKYSDIGGIYRNWENEPGKIYMGKAPLSNASRAPGLWQRMYISFSAPRFDAAGKKVSNARFNRVTLNGVVIHDNVEVPLPTGGPLENNETPRGPIMIQGDHGPVAFRNIGYKLMSAAEYELGPISYEVWHGNFSSPSDFSSQKPEVTGTTKDLTVEVVDVENSYGIRFKGELTVPMDARYTFQALYTGGGKFVLNNREMFNYPIPDGWHMDTASITLKAGTYPFELYNFKTASWMAPRLSLTVRTPDTYQEDLHALGSFPPSDNPTAPIFLEPDNKPRLHRGFVDFEGNRSRRLTHTIGVGDPSGVHYIYDMRSANLVCVWKGDFVDATPMWHDRGDGSFRPLGSPLFRFNNQALAKLASENAPFPDAAAEGQYQSKGFLIDENSGRPVFMTVFEGVELEERIYPEEDNLILSHEIIVKKGQPQGLYYKLAEGSDIEQMPDGSWAVDDHRYYVRVGLGVKPFVRDVAGKKELVAAFPQQSLKYSIIW